MLYTTQYVSPVGNLLLAEKNDCLVGLWIEGQKYFGGSLQDERREVGNSPVLQAARSWLDLYFAGQKPPIGELPLAPIGSDFREAVWKILREIPYGEVTTYGDVSKRLAERCGFDRMSARAVGGAVGHNPISIIIPCHRVIGANRNLTGYAGGLQKKIKLLIHEGVDITQFTVYSHIKRPHCSAE